PGIRWRLRRPHDRAQRSRRASRVADRHVPPAAAARADGRRGRRAADERARPLVGATADRARRVVSAVGRAARARRPARGGGGGARAMTGNGNGRSPGPRPHPKRDHGAGRTSRVPRRTLGVVAAGAALLLLGIAIRRGLVTHATITGARDVSLMMVELMGTV